MILLVTVRRDRITRLAAAALLGAALLPGLGIVSAPCHPAPLPGALPPGAASPESPAHRSRAPLIFVDPGHGGIDGGACRGPLLEKDLNLDIGLRLRRALWAEGLAVRMTRAADHDLSPYPGRGRHRRDLEARVRLLRDSGAALYVSLHADASADPRRQGAVAYYGGRNGESRRLAQHLQDALNALQDAPATRHRPQPASLRLLREVPLPGAVVEVGFLSNAADRARLASPEHRDGLARALARGVLTYLAEPPPGSFQGDPLARQGP